MAVKISHYVNGGCFCKLMEFLMENYVLNIQVYLGKKKKTIFILFYFF